MKSKLNFLINMSLRRKIKSKWFVIANVILAILIIGIVNIDTIISKFGGDFEESTNVYVVDNTNISFEIFKENLTSDNILDMFGINGKEYEVILFESDLKYAEENIEEYKNAIFIQFDNDEANYIKATILSKEYIDTTDYQLITTAINNTKTAIAMQYSGIPLEEFEKIYAQVEIERVILDENKNSDEESTEMFMSAIFPVLILPFFMLAVYLIQMVGAEVNDEKSTRGMEIIISNVSPKTHFFAKVIAGNLFVIIQGGLLLLFTGLGLFLRKFIGGTGSSNAITKEITSIIDSILNSSIGGKLSIIIPITLLLMFLTFIGYALLAGILASMTTNTEDFQQLQTPLVVILLAGYYLSMMAGMFKGALFIRILSYFPFISAILAPSLLMLGQIGVIDIIISIVVMVFVLYVLIKYGLRIYKVGILNYTSKDLWKKMFKALKENS